MREGAGARCSPAAGRPARASRPSPVPSCGPGSRKNGDVDAEAAARARAAARRGGGSSRSSRGEPERGRGVGAAAAEAGSDRDPLLDRRAPARLDACGCGDLDERARGRACRRRTRSTESAGAGSSETVSARSIRWRSVATSCRPSSRIGPTTRARLIFAGAGALDHASCGGEARRTRAARAPRRARAGPRPIASSAAAAACSREATPGERERVGERLAAVRERRLDEPLHAGVDARPSAAERDERRLDVRPRPEHLARHGMEAGALGRELQQHRDRAVGLRPRHGEEAVGDLALHHHAPEARAREAVEALDHERRRDVVRQVRDELRRRRLERRPGRARARPASGSSSAGCRGGAARASGRARRRARGRRASAR